MQLVQIEQPFCALTEKAVLSVVLDGRHPDSWPIVRENCPTNDHFFVRNHKLIAMCCDALLSAGKSIDAQTIATHAASVSFNAAIEAMLGKKTYEHEPEVPREESLLQGLGGMSALLDIQSSAGSAAALADNCEALSAFCRRRELIRTCMEAAEQAASAPSADAIADGAIMRLAGIRTPHGKATGSTATAVSVVAQHDDLADRKTEIQVGSYGIESLDAAMPLRRGKMYTAAAAPGCGKTSCALMAATHTARLLGPHSVAFLSLEMSAEELVLINLAREAKVPKDRLENGRLTAVQRESVRMTQEDMAKHEFYINDSDDNSTVDGICSWIRQKHIASRGVLHLVCIDYIQLIEAKNNRQPEREMLVEASRKLKKLSRQLDICILVLSQMNAAGTKEEHDKNGALKTRPEPRLEDLHGSSTIGKDSDGVFFITSQVADTSNATIPVQFKIAKNRGGREFKFEAEFRRGDGQRFVEIRRSCETENPDVSIPSRTDRMERGPQDPEDLFQ